MPENFIPGTTIEFSESDGTFARFKPLIKATNGLTLSQVCSITNLEPSTIQNWVKRGFVAKPVQKKYHERQLARILLISSLRDAMRIESIGELMAMVNGSADDESDDIISEQELYDYLCELIKKWNNSIPRIDEIPEITESTISAFKPKNKNDYNKLKEALSIMICAYISAKYKQAAQQQFDNMKERLK